MFSQATVQTQNLISSITAGLTLPQGETNVSAEVSVVNAYTNGVNVLTMPTLSGGLVPSGWRIYRGTSSGNETYLATLSGDDVTFYDDGTAVGTATAPPSAYYGYLGQLPQSIGAVTASNPGSAYQDIAFAGTATTQTVSYDTYAFAQGFIAHATNLDSIDLPVDYTGSPHSLTMSIYPQTYTLTNSTQMSIPNTYTASGPTTPIATVTMTAAQLNRFGATSNYTRFQFPSPVTLTKGQFYYIVLSVSNSTDTTGSGNHFTWYGSFNGTSLTTCVNHVLYGYGYQVFAPNGTSNAQVNQAWIGVTTGAFGYKINGQGTLSAGTYYYVVTACTGFVEKARISGYDSGGFNGGSVYFCSADGSDKFYPVLLTNGSNNFVDYGIYERYSNQTHLCAPFFTANLANGTAVANQSYVYNLILTTIYTNSGGLSGTANTTFRLHTYSNYFYLGVAGDSANSGFQEGICFVGTPTALGPGDKPHIITGGANGWFELRDFGNNVNSSIYPVLPTSSAALFSQNANNDVVPYYNNYTGNNDGVTLSLYDSYGVRATMPNLILIPHGSRTTINNHDTFVVTGNTYIVYQTLNYSGDATTYRPFSVWSFSIGGLNLVTDYYPAVQIS